MMHGAAAARSTKFVLDPMMKLWIGSAKFVISIRAPNRAGDQR